MYPSPQPIQRHNSLDILTARRCWQKIDAGSSGFVTANDLQQYLSKFISQQSRNTDSYYEPEEFNQNNTFDTRRDEEEFKFTSASSLPAAASSSSSSSSPAASSSAAAAAAASSASSSNSGLNARARQLSVEASKISAKDLDDLILFADCNNDGKLDLDELMSAYACFTNPTVSLTRERFQSQITAKGLEGARPKKASPPPSQGVNFRSQLGLGMGAPILGLTPPPNASSSPSTSSSTVPTLPSIFAAASLPAEPMIRDGYFDSKSESKPEASTVASPAAGAAANEPESAMSH